MTDVGTTPRKALTPTQRLRLFESHAGRCALCGQQIAAGQAWIVEHLRALALGGSNDGDNLAPVHEACAATKTTTEDIPRIAKAKRQKMAHLNIKPTASRPIQSRGFAKKPRTHADRPALPPRPIFQEEQ